jgi:nitrate reductase beta subunit
MEVIHIVDIDDYDKVYDALKKIRAISAFQRALSKEEEIDREDIKTVGYILYQLSETALAALTEKR